MSALAVGSEGRGGSQLGRGVGIRVGRGGGSFPFSPPASFKLTAHVREQDEDLTDFEDEFGRTRRVPRSELPISVREAKRMNKMASEPR